MQATKWLKLPLFLDASELQALFDYLGQIAIIPLSGVFPKGKEELSFSNYIALYSQYLERLHKGDYSDPDKKLITAWTLDPQDVEERQVATGFLVKPLRPVIQVQPYWLNYSETDGKFHEMAFSKESLAWGLLFSFPQLFQESKTLDIVKVKEPEFPNAGLFKALQRFSREATLPTPFTTPAGQVNFPARIGKKMLPQAALMPQLQSKGLKCG